MAVSNVTFTRGGGGIGFEGVIPAGVYPATITEVNGCMIAPYKGEGDPKPGIAFEVDVELGNTIMSGTHEVSASVGNKSKLRAILDNLKPGRLTPDVLNSDKDIANLINELREARVQVIIKVKTSQSGKQYSVIDSFLPAQNTAVANVQPKHFEQDDIPF